jgi:hypothetical protein
MNQRFARVTAAASHARRIKLRRRARATRPVRFTLFARVYIDPCERSRRRRPQALGVLGGPICPSTQAISCP